MAYPSGGSGGVIPSSGSVFNELASVTRRAFIPNLVVQLYFASPTLFYMLGGSQKSAGGLQQITIPVQGQSMVQGQFVGYSGSFNSPQIIPGMQNAQFNTAYWTVPIPIPFGESMIQSTEVVIPILKARMNDAYAVTVQNMAGLAFTNNSANSLYPNSFYDAFDSGTNVANYGGINRTASGNAFWAGQTLAASAIGTGATQVSVYGFQRATMASTLIQITDAAGGEAPTFVVMNPGDFATLNNAFIGTETIFTRPGNEYSMGTAVRSSFPNLNINGVPVYADHFCPQGTCYVVNRKYTALYASEDAFFDFSGFYSLVPLNQIGQQGVMLLGYNIISSKPVSGAKITGIGGNAF
jgi:hypothetical protein